MGSLFAAAKAVLRFRDYQPQRVTFTSARAWLKQFKGQDQKIVATLLDHIIYFSESDTRDILVAQNDALLRRLVRAGVASKNVIYMQVHDAGSSSPVMLSMLKIAGRLERFGCKFMDSRDSLGLNKLTNELAEGAIIYVDDFSGSGDQFCQARDFAFQNVIGNFSEFLLVPCACEEALQQIAKRGIEIVTGYIHSKAERPLHEHSPLLSDENRLTICTLCSQINKKAPLGYRELATMAVSFRGAPTSIPSIFRGSTNQTPFKGIFPRPIDLPKKRI